MKTLKSLFSFLSQIISFSEIISILFYDNVISFECCPRRIFLAFPIMCLNPYIILFTLFTLFFNGTFNLFTIIWKFASVGKSSDLTSSRLA